MNTRLILQITRRGIGVLFSGMLLAACFLVPHFAAAEEVKPTAEPARDISRLLDGEYWRPAQMKVIWHTRLANKPKLAVVSKNYLIVADDMNMLYALERGSGIIRWRRDIGSPVDEVSLGENDLIVRSMDVLRRMDERSGKFLWTKSLGFVPASEIIRSSSRICTSAWGRKVYTLNLEECRVVWKVNVSDNVLGKIIDEGSRVYIAAENGRLSALNGRTGDKLWKLDLEGDIAAGLAVDGSIIYVGSQDKILYACSKLGKGILWKLHTKGPIMTTPVTTEGMVYFRAEGDGLYAVDNKGSLKWKLDGDVRLLSIGEQHTVLLVDKDDITVVKTDSGKPISGSSSVRMPHFTLFPQNIEGPEIFCLSKAGDIVALAPF